MILDALLSAILQVAVIGGLPLAGFAVYHRWKHRRSVIETLKLAGLQGSPWKYMAYSLAGALLGVVVIIVWEPSLEMFTREGSAQRQFVGLGLTGRAFSRAILYGAVQTGFAEELLFRGLIAGSLSRRFSLALANLLQAAIFLLPHFLILLVMPEMWGLLPVVFVGALLFGWIRIRSGSIFGSWLMHATGNVAMALSIAIRTAG